MGQVKKSAERVEMNAWLHAGDCSVAAELMNALAVCGLDQLRELREMMRRGEASSDFFANIETFDIVEVLLATIQTQALAVAKASEAIQRFESGTRRRKRAADRGEASAA